MHGKLLKGSIAASVLASLALSACSEEPGIGPALESGIDLVKSKLLLLLGTSGADAAGTRYIDDTHSLPAGTPVTRLSGDQPPRGYYMPRKKQPGRAVVDARGARFVLNNSKNLNPSPAARCDTGTLLVNPYPVNIFSAEEVTLVGGLVAGSVPQRADFDGSYCNSAAINYKNAPGGIIDGVRISRAWDGVRIGPASDGFLVKNAWLSSIRDDAIENDHLLSGTIEDTLIDGTLQGVSLRPNARSKLGASQAVVRITGSLIRLQEYPYKGAESLGSLAKADPRSPRLVVTNSVIAIDSPTDTSWASSWEIMRNRTQGSNNVLLWLSDRPMPAGSALPSSFQVITGAQAREVWARAKANWINCHPQLARVPGDPVSDPSRCRAATWGGFNR